MDKNELAYLAGFFDGEGSIIIKVKNYPSNLSHTVQCSIGSNVEESILIYHRAFGGNLWYDRSKLSRANFKQSHWEITGNQCLAFLKQIEPYLKSKKKEALVAISFQEERANLSVVARELIRHQLHKLKGNKRILKNYGILPV